MDPSGKTVISMPTNTGDDGTGIFLLPVNNPLKWTAEEPNLYTLHVSVNRSQYIPTRVGFRQVESKDGLIKVNGKRIVLRGANRHEHHPEHGRTVPLEFLKQDLLLMKQHNINAIRTSHQPNDPRLLDLADELGFWVVDEADLECHGFETIERAKFTPEQKKLTYDEKKALAEEKAGEWTSNNPEWTKAYVDRAEHLIKRDQLHPSVIIWSLGNEGFYGQNFKAMYDHIKQYDGRPVHYEADREAASADMFSVMYPTVERIIEFGKDETKEKPLVLCEYVSLMPLIYNIPILTNICRFTLWVTDPVTSKNTSTPSTRTPSYRVASCGNGLTTDSLPRTRPLEISSTDTVVTLGKKCTTPLSSWTVCSTPIIPPTRV